MTWFTFSNAANSVGSLPKWKIAKIYTPDNKQVPVFNTDGFDENFLPKSDCKGSNGNSDCYPAEIHQLIEIDKTVCFTRQGFMKLTRTPEDPSFNIKIGPGAVVCFGHPADYPNPTLIIAKETNTSEPLRYLVEESEKFDLSEIKPYFAQEVPVANLLDFVEDIVLEKLIMTETERLSNNSILKAPFNVLYSALRAVPAAAAKRPDCSDIHGNKVYVEESSAIALTGSSDRLDRLPPPFECWSLMNFASVVTYFKKKPTPYGIAVIPEGYGQTVMPRGRLRYGCLSSGIRKIDDNVTKRIMEFDRLD
ncbi:hypothetical protein [Gloeobacter morelensis]|uniref:Uncharacterized protein n=1 Tax=Gloeobacter morelensis MG652769 TaxID=2781736 RepID=A0ABY3PHJ5_9CYAN|nr:hypothetical protein [Gloeobacter morelensis]UFP93142.1 hypothetical protein ISF26_15170 [Gloeobacter morelensis MG652769]